MIQIHRFIDKVAAIDNKRGNSVIIPIDDAKGLCTELTKLLLTLHEREKVVATEPVQVIVTGGGFK